MGVLLTGGAGYIGGVAVMLAHSGCEVLLCDNLSSSSDEKLIQITDWQIPFVKGDVINTKLLKGALVARYIDAVVQPVRLKAVGESVVKPVDCCANNVQGAVSLL